MLKTIPTRQNIFKKHTLIYSLILDITSDIKQN